MKTPPSTPPAPFPVSPVPTAWDDLLRNIATPQDWTAKRPAVRQRFLDLILHDAAPEPPPQLPVTLQQEIPADGFTLRYIRYPVEADEEAHAWIAIPDGTPPPGGFPAVICLHGTTNWGARRNVGLPPLPGDPHENKGFRGLDMARQLARRGYVTISPEHFCAASRIPAEGPFDTAAFYRRHPKWSAVGKYIFDSSIACSVISAMPQVNPDRIGVTGHSLGGQGSFWLAAFDDRIRCVVPSGAAGTFRENPEPWHWSRDYWYIYFPQIRVDLLAGRTIECDFHEMMSLIAPRPLLECFALNDGYPLSRVHRTLMHTKLHELYSLLNAGAAHSFLVFGDGHSIPDISRSATLSWMDRWLKYDGNPLGGWHPSPATGSV